MKNMGLTGGNIIQTLGEPRSGTPSTAQRANFTKKMSTLSSRWAAWRGESKLLITSLNSHFARI